MKVLNLSSADSVSQSFNGVAWREPLLQRGCQSRLTVHWQYESDAESVAPVSPFWQRPRLMRAARLINRFQYALNVSPALSIWDAGLFRRPEYVKADVVHMHIVHDGWLRLKSIQRVLREKPTVMTWHDAWPMTGRCIQPGTCNRFTQGCGSCPDLLREHPAVIDRSAPMRRLKASIWEANDFQVHVSTAWMQDLIRKSGIRLRREPAVFPFGIKMPRQVGNDERQFLRESFDIPAKSVVVGFRATTQSEKGLSFCLELARMLRGDSNVYFVSVQDAGRLNSYVPRDRVLDLGTLNAEQMNIFYDLLDVFVMPSTAESFGMMALEALSHGVPVIARPGTAVAEVVGGDGTAGMVTVSTRDAAEWVKRLNDPGARALFREHCLARVQSKFSMDVFADHLVQLYRDTIDGRTLAGPSESRRQPE